MPVSRRIAHELLEGRAAEVDILGAAFQEERPLVASADGVAVLVDVGLEKDVAAKRHSLVVAETLARGMT